MCVSDQMCRYHTGSSCRLALVCKEEKMSRPPFACKQPHCDQFCARLHPKGWGKCKDHDRFMCQCFYVCYKNTPLPKSLKPNWPKPAWMILCQFYFFLFYVLGLSNGCSGILINSSAEFRWNFFYFNYSFYLLP